MKVTIGDLRRLLESELPDPTLILIEGQVRVVSAADDDNRSGAIEVTTQAELRSRLSGGPEPGDGELEAVAATLNTMIVERGA
ncbi:hypothetical protein [Amycolatopsis regifaucium]|uniref:Uncharacterized protein n=1 Tax=Amycolatopsis regifaucium TaxID=546365 RepID=A0A154M8L3_9PSEU|nr:hypothetical protein [Amycolatopsis regifaucium]KZB80912.1 hypothetical protein AVL48_37810 [Amycolatopsis regifaucium]OKA03880.1 hypothetical protein ATP06_0234015 [Amycolatopsis regifaucium]SFJ74643.1 hypothetical protein SAMN04489731_1381 [Amycolatopsis regifaucium]